MTFATLLFNFGGLLLGSLRGERELAPLDLTRFYPGATP